LFSPTFDHFLVPLEVEAPAFSFNAYRFVQPSLSSPYIKMSVSEAQCFALFRVDETPNNGKVNVQGRLIKECILVLHRGNPLGVLTAFQIFC
jgi:hypothetical protein